MQSFEKFNFNWVLNNQLSIGSKPNSKENYEFLKEKRTISILSLCEINKHDEALLSNFHFFTKNLILPDHKSIDKMTIKQLKIAVDELNNLLKYGPTFVHCYAGIERSTTVILSWLKLYKKLQFETALEYLMQVHPMTNPLSYQLQLVREV